MSNFTVKLKTPNNKIVEADMLDDYFQSIGGGITNHYYGLKIKGEDRIQRVTEITESSIYSGGIEYKIIRKLL